MGPPRPVLGGRGGRGIAAAAAAVAKAVRNDSEDRMAAKSPDGGTMLVAAAVYPMSMDVWLKFGA